MRLSDHPSFQLDAESTMNVWSHVKKADVALMSLHDSLSFQRTAESKIIVWSHVKKRNIALIFLHHSSKNLNRPTCHNHTHSHVKKRDIALMSLHDPLFFQVGAHCPTNICFVFYWSVTGKEQAATDHCSLTSLVTLAIQSRVLRPLPKWACRMGYWRNWNLWDLTYRTTDLIAAEKWTVKVPILWRPDEVLKPVPTGCQLVNADQWYISLWY